MASHARRGARCAVCCRRSASTRGASYVCTVGAHDDVHTPFAAVAAGRRAGCAVGHAAGRRRPAAAQLRRAVPRRSRLRPGSRADVARERQLSASRDQRRAPCSASIASSTSSTALPGVEAAAIDLERCPGVRDQAAAWSSRSSKGGPATRARMIAESRVVSPDYFADDAHSRCCRRTVPRRRMPAARRRRRPRRWSTAASPIATLPGDRRSVCMSPAVSTTWSRTATCLQRLPSRIVGIVGDARERGQTASPCRPCTPASALRTPRPGILVRTAGDPAARPTRTPERSASRAAARSVYDIAPLEQRIGDAYAQNRLRTWLLVAVCRHGALARVRGRVRHAELRRQPPAARGRRCAWRLAHCDASIVRQLIGTACASSASACACGLGLALAIHAQALSAMLYGVTPPIRPRWPAWSGSWSRSRRSRR